MGRFPAPIQRPPPTTPSGLSHSLQQPPPNIAPTSMTQPPPLMPPPSTQSSFSQAPPVVNTNNSYPPPLMSGRTNPRNPNSTSKQKRFLDPATPPFKSSAVSTSMSAPTSSSTWAPVSGQSETGLASETQPTPVPRPLLEARPLMAVDIPCVVSSTASSSSLQHQQQLPMPRPPPLMPEITAPSLSTAASSAAVSAASSNVDVSST